MKKILFIGMFTLLSVLSARAYDFEVDGIYYNITSNTTVEVTFKKTPDDAYADNRDDYFGVVVVPATVTYGGVTYSVTTIGEGAFFRCSGLTSVTIPEGVTAIGYGAFNGCYDLTSVTIPESVTTIGYYALMTNGRILSVYYMGDIAQWCGMDFGFDWISSWNLYINNAKVLDLLIPDGVTEIGDYAFDGCEGLTSVTIPDGVTSIGDGAFERCTGLASVNISESVISIGDGAFEGCSGLTSVNIPESVVSIGAFAFAWSGLTFVNIPESVISIGAHAFYGTAIGSPLYNSKIFAYLPENYKGEYVIPAGIQLIVGGAFVCDSLFSVTLPESLDTIADVAFGGAYSLRNVYSLAKNPPKCGTDDAFYIYENLYVPRGSKDAYASEWDWGLFKIYEFGVDGTGVITLQVNNESMGRVTGGGEYELDEQVKLEAIPNAGYHFEKWDDGNTDNPRMLTVTCDMVLTAMFAKDAPTANESVLSAAPIAYVQGRTAYLADGLGEVEAFTVTGQRVYRGTARTLTLPRPGIYVLRVVADGRRCKVVVR